MGARGGMPTTIGCGGANHVSVKEIFHSLHQSSSLGYCDPAPEVNRTALKAQGQEGALSDGVVVVSVLLGCSLPFPSCRVCASIPSRGE